MPAVRPRAWSMGRGRRSPIRSPAEAVASSWCRGRGPILARSAAWRLRPAASASIPRSQRPRSSASRRRRRVRCVPSSGRRGAPTASWATPRCRTSARLAGRTAVLSASTPQGGSRATPQTQRIPTGPSSGPAARCRTWARLWPVGWGMSGRMATASTRPARLPAWPTTPPSPTRLPGSTPAPRSRGWASSVAGTPRPSRSTTPGRSSGSRRMARATTAPSSSPDRHR